MQGRLVNIFRSPVPAALKPPRSARDSNIPSRAETLIIYLSGFKVCVSDGRLECEWGERISGSGSRTRMKDMKVFTEWAVMTSVFVLNLVDGFHL